jgi:predicted acetyltransferase
MSNTVIRRMNKSEMLEVMHPLTTYAFRSSPPLFDKEEWQQTVRQREGVTYFALSESDTVVATVASTAMTQQVRGTLYDAGGVWGVATHPAARRKGYCKRLMARLLAAEREAGRPLSCLYPFRESFYETLGYVTFPSPRIAKLAPSTLQPLLKKDLGGQVDLMLIGDGYDTYRHYLYKLQKQVHGLGIFVHGQKALVQQRNRSWLALARVDGELVGVMLYDLKGEEPTRFTMRALRFYYDTSPGKYLLLQWIARHVDQASEVEIWLPSFERPETWLADIQVTTESQVRAPMGRIVDVAGLGGMQTGPGRFSARINDPLCPWNEGVWQFETVDGALQVRPAEAEQADCNLTIQALTALIYGTHDVADFVIRGWGTPSPELRTILQSIFVPQAPYLHEYF